MVNTSYLLCRRGFYNSYQFMFRVRSLGVTSVDIWFQLTALRLADMILACFSFVPTPASHGFRPRLLWKDHHARSVTYVP